MGYLKKEKCATCMILFFTCSSKLYFFYTSFLVAVANRTFLMLHGAAVAISLSCMAWALARTLKASRPQALQPLTQRHNLCILLPIPLKHEHIPTGHVPQMGTCSRARNCAILRQYFQASTMQTSAMPAT